jgi:transketolase
MRAAIRVAALSKYPTMFVFTHDSIGLGEDGPTHQPVEQLAALRAIPNLLVIRPADANETVQAWKFTLQYRDGPVVLLFTRQGLPVLDQNRYSSATNLSKGAYILVGADKSGLRSLQPSQPLRRSRHYGGEGPDVLLLASGSEVSIALQAAEKLATEGIKAQVVSMPCWGLFEKQDKEYRESVIPPDVKARVGIEAGVEMGWHKWLGEKGVFIGMSTFGASAPAKVCFEKFGITSDKVVEAAKRSMGITAGDS